MKEKDVRDLIYARLNELKHRHPLTYEAIVGSARQRRGLPDIRVVFYGLSLDIELKRDDKHEATPAQLKAIKDLCRAGGTAIVCYSIEQLDHVLDQLLRLARQFVYCPKCHAPNVDNLHHPFLRCSRCGYNGRDFHDARNEL